MSINKLIIIGNGFDLAHGLKTRYSDFVLWYLDRQYNILSHSYSTNKEDIISLSSGHTVPSSKIKSVKQFHDLIEGYTIKSESTNKLFAKILNETLSYNWVDIENIFYKELINIYKQHELNLDDIISTTIKKAKKLNNDLIAIKELLEIYLTEIENSSFDIKSEISSHFAQISYDDPKTATLCLNFNYTSTIKKYDISRLQLINIHGLLNNLDNPLIFGYGDEMDEYYEKIERLNSNELLRSFKSFYYFKTTHYQDVIRFVDNNPFEVHIMGHSCGLSDRVLLNSIFEHEHCKKIKLYYHENNELVNDFFEKTQEISRHFKPENKGKMRTKIVPFDESKPLLKYRPN